MTIASRRRPKVEWTKRGILRAAALFGIGADAFQFEEADAASGVADTPLSVAELLEGSRNRARAVFVQGEAESYAVGVEGGLFTEGERTFLQSWACVFDGRRFAYGASGAIQIPKRLADEVVRRGVDLGEAIDRFAAESDVRSRQGTWGVLTNDGVTREDSFDAAAFNAIVPFWNERVYRL